jgi:hypothetical protein
MLSRKSDLHSEKHNELKTSTNAGRMTSNKRVLKNANLFSLWQFRPGFKCHWRKRSANQESIPHLKLQPMQEGEQKCRQHQGLTFWTWNPIPIKLATWSWNFCVHKVTHEKPWYDLFEDVLPFVLEIGAVTSQHEHGQWSLCGRGQYMFNGMWRRRPLKMNFVFGSLINWTSGKQPFSFPRFKNKINKYFKSIIRIANPSWTEHLHQHFQKSFVDGKNSISFASA